MRDELIATLTRVKPAAVALVDDEGRIEWLAVTRGARKWERMVDRVIGDRAWTELRLCDGRKATIEVVRAVAAEPEEATPPLDDAIAAAAAGGAGGAVNMGQLAGLFAGLVRDVTKSVSSAVTETVKTMRTESRQELATVLEAHQDMSRDAFELRAADHAALAVEQQRRLDLEREVADLRAQLAAGGGVVDAATARAQQREEAIFGMLTGGQGNGPGQTGDPSQGMPSGN